MQQIPSTWIAIGARAYDFDDGELRCEALRNFIFFDAHEFAVGVGRHFGRAVKCIELIIAAGAQVDQLREELQALVLRRESELASLLEHQKAFSEAKEVIEELQGDVASLHKQTMLFESEVQRLGKLLFDRTWLGHLRRLMGRR